MGKKEPVTSSAEIKLYKCVPEAWLWMPKPARLAIGWITAVLFSASFLIVPISIVGLPLLWSLSPTASIACAVLLTLSMLLPQTEWADARKLGQLWYELFDFSCNLSPEECERRIQLGNVGQYAIGMHPHGIIPLQAVLWAAYCDQYLSSKSGALYGFGATADVVMYLPVLRNIMVSVICNVCALFLLIQIHSGLADCRLCDLFRIERRPGKGDRKYAHPKIKCPPYSICK
jgi:hypothetical protein